MFREWVGTQDTWGGWENPFSVRVQVAGGLSQRNFADWNFTNPRLNSVTRARHFHGNAEEILSLVSFLRGFGVGEEGQGALAGAVHHLLIVGDGV